MKMIAYVLGIVCVFVAVVYLLVPADSLPSFFPGFEAGMTRVRVKHGIAAAVAGVILIAGGWWAGRSRS